MKKGCTISRGTAHLGTNDIDARWEDLPAVRTALNGSKRYIGRLPIKSRIRNHEGPPPPEAKIAA